MGLGGYILKRTAYSVLLLVLVASLNFVIFRLIPSDPLTTIVAGSRLQPEQVDILRRRYHIGEPLSTQYFYYISNLLQGEFGYSYRTQRPILEELGQVMPNSILLLGTSTIVSIFVGIFLGILAAARRGRIVDLTVMFSAMFFLALPAFWTGLMLLIVFGFYLPIFPLRGTISVPAPTNLLGYSVDVLWHLTLPAITLILFSFAQYAIIVRNSMLNVLTEDYITVARAKGLSERAVLFKHAMKNAMLPVVTVISMRFGGIFSGAIIAETVFSWDGVGRYLWSAIEFSDYPVLQAVFLVVALASILANFAADVLYGTIDPRINH